MGLTTNFQFIHKLPKINTTVSNYLNICLIVYICIVSRYVPEKIINIINTPISRLLVIIGIIWVAQSSIITALLLSVSLVITINLKNMVRLAELAGIQTEHFADLTADVASDTSSNASTVSDSDSDSNSSNRSDSDSVSLVSDSDSNSNSTTDTNSTRDSDDSSVGDTDSVESFTVNSVSQDDFTKLHNAIHQFDQFLTEK
jgi:hypothetical protein